MRKLFLSLFFTLFALPSFGKDFIKPSINLQGLDMAGCLILNEETAKAGESYYRISPDTFQKATDRVTDKLYRVEGNITRRSPMKWISKDSRAFQLQRVAFWI
nr:hypothetical protein [Escherichia coli]